MEMTVGMGQTRVEGGARAANLDRSAAMIGAAAVGCDVVVLSKCLERGGPPPGSDGSERRVILEARYGFDAAGLPVARCPLR